MLMLLEPHLSGTLLILGIGAVLMFVGGTGLKWFALAGIAGAGAIAAAVVLLPELVPYAMGRLSSWRDPFADPLGEGHQTIQSLYAIASGGAAGLGLGNSRQHLQAKCRNKSHQRHPLSAKARPYHGFGAGLAAFGYG